MKRLKRDKVKRGRIILSAILTIALALLSLGFGGYLGYVTLNINYITIGTMTGEVGGLLVVAGFFIFFGVIGGGIALKEIFIAHRNEEKFSAYKGALYSAIVFYVVIALISIVGVISSFISFVPSNFTWAIVGLGVLSLVLSGGCFYLVFRELKDHKKNMKKMSGDNQFVNLDLTAGEIRKFSDMRESGSDGKVSSNDNTRVFGQGDNKRDEDGNRNSGIIRNVDHVRNDKHNASDNNINQSSGSRDYYERDLQNDVDLTLAKAILEINKYHENNSSPSDRIVRTDGNQLSTADQQLATVNFEELAVNLMQLEELRKAGLINDQEYQTLKKRCLT